MQQTQGEGEAMAEEQTQTTEPTSPLPETETGQKLGFNAFDVQAPEVYANNTEIIVGASEVTIAFGYDLDVSGMVSKTMVRVVVSHNSFLRMMQYWGKRVKFLEGLYGGSPLSLHDFLAHDPEGFKAAVDEMMGKSEQ